MCKENEMPVITIITPYYNVKKVLFDNCVKSVVEQTYKNIEWIIVDDGSEKEYAENLDNVEKKYSFITAFHQKNNGPAHARNTALEKMSGKYFTFLDADDYLQKDFIEILYKKMKATNSDIVIGNMLYVSENEKEILDRGENKIEVTIPMTESNRRRLVDSFFRKKSHELSCENRKIETTNLWTVDNMGGKLYSKDIHGNVKFCSKVIHSQDNIYCLDTMLASKKISFVTDAYYFYIKNEGSHSLKRKGIEKYEEYFKELYKRLENWPEIFAGKMSNMILDIAYHLADNVSFTVFYKDLKNTVSHPLIRDFAKKIKIDQAAFKQQKRTIYAIKNNRIMYLALCVYVGKIKLIYGKRKI